MKKKGMDVQFSKAEFLNLTNAVGNKMVDVLGMFPKLVAMSILINEVGVLYLSCFVGGIYFKGYELIERIIYNYNYMSFWVNLMIIINVLSNSLQSRDASSSSLPSEMAFPNPSLLQLKRVEIFIWHKLDSIFLDIEILLANAPMLEKMVFRLRNYDAHNPNKSILVQEIREKMMSMPSASPTAKLIIIGESRKGNIMIHF